MAKAKLTIDIWTRDEGDDLPDDLAEALAMHVEHVAGLCAQGFTAGEIVDDDFKGLWNIETLNNGD